MTRRKVILDCDPGHDDAIAILLAARSPVLELRAITVVAGNQTLEKTLNNALRVCSFAGIDEVPIAAGAAHPLVREQIIAGDIHGATGLDGPNLGPPTIEAVDEHAVDVVAREVLAAPGEITLIPVGPLTNIAMALRREPSLAEKIAAIVLMGGGITKGNVTPAAEFNIHADPEAAHIVFTCGAPIKMVGLDVTHQSMPGPEERERIRQLGTSVGRLVDELLTFFGQSYLERFGFHGPPIHDAVAVAQAIDSSVVGTKHVNVAIETKGTLTYGMTVCDMHGVTGRKPNADAGVELNRERFWDLLLEGLARY